MVRFSASPKNEPHSPPFCASEASTKVPFNAYFEFMYGFKIGNGIVTIQFLFQSIYFYEKGL
ncbi:MAG: hypothetical protein U5L45_09370 [Saprospiraceae bacterium]|nr:hypothetical protein [Saprospiraceae bacterium]